MRISEGEERKREENRGKERMFTWSLIRKAFLK